MIKNQRLIELDDVNAWSVTTEAFLAQIHRSSDLLRQDKQDEARAALEQAFESRVDDAAGQATLALVYFKLGIYSRALAIYQKLVKELPEEAPLRLNLGLVYLKTGQSERAARELETAVRLAPGYRKAHGYLGLAYQRLGDYEGARRSFELAGAKHLANRMKRFTKPSTEPTPEDAPEAREEPPVPASLNERPSNALDLSSNIAGFLREMPTSEAPPSLLPRKGERNQEPVSIAEIQAEARLSEPLTGRFLINESGYLIMEVASTGISRLEGLHFLSATQLSYKPLKRKYRGKTDEEIFGRKSNPMFEITGSGRLGFHPGDACFSAVDLEDEVAYLREELLFAMDPTLRYENGRIPGDGGMLVHVSGRGALVMKTAGKPRTLEVTPDRGVIIPRGDLVGWFGHLLPRPAANSPFDPSLGALELVGEGLLLVCFK